MCEDKRNFLFGPEKLAETIFANECETVDTYYGFPELKAMTNVYLPPNKSTIKY